MREGVLMKTNIKKLLGLSTVVIFTMSLITGCGGNKLETENTLSDIETVVSEIENTDEINEIDDIEFEGDDFIPDASLSDEEAAIMAVRWYGYDAEYYISLGMKALTNGSVDIDGANCILVEFGTDTAEKFTSEYQFAYNRANNAVYKYDIIMDEWERCN